MENIATASGARKRHTGHGCVDIEQIGLGTEDFSTLLEDVERMLFGYTSFTIEVVLQERHVRL